MRQIRPSEHPLPGGLAAGFSVETVVRAGSVLTAAQAYCEEKLAFLIADIPAWVNTLTEVREWLQGAGVRHRNSAVYFPRLEIPDALNQNRLRNVGASGTLATTGGKAIGRTSGSVPAAAATIASFAIALPPPIRSSAGWTTRSGGASTSTSASSWMP